MRQENKSPSGMHMASGLAGALALTTMALAAGCVGFSVGDKKASGGTSQTTQEATTNGGDAGAADAFAGGVDCVIHPSTGRPMCSGVAACPELFVDHDVFPNCGFRPNSAAGTLDLECACNAATCPVGAAATCEQAARLLTTQTEALVCMQIAEGRCSE